MKQDTIGSQKFLKAKYKNSNKIKNKTSQIQTGGRYYNNNTWFETRLRSKFLLLFRYYYEYCNVWEEQISKFSSTFEDLFYNSDCDSKLDQGYDKKKKKRARAEVLELRDFKQRG